MNHRERLQTVMRGEIPDCVPVCPDISNMIPCRLTGKPFWQIYVYQDPPLWKAYIDAVKFFDIDGGFELYQFGDLFGTSDDDEMKNWPSKNEGSPSKNEGSPSKNEGSPSKNEGRTI